MSQAYQQLVLDEEFTKYVVINTSKGLFRYNFWCIFCPSHISTSYGRLVTRIEEYGGVLDDILITGGNDGEHLHILTAVLTRMQQSGLRLSKAKCEFI